MAHNNSHHQPSGRDMRGDSHTTTTSRRKEYDDESVYSQAHWSDFRRKLNDDESRYSQAHESDVHRYREPSRSHSVGESSRRGSTVRKSSHATVRAHDSKHEGKHEGKHSHRRPSTDSTTKHDTPSRFSRAESVRIVSAAKDSHRSTHHVDSHAVVKKDESRHSTADRKDSSARHESHHESHSTLKSSTQGVYGSSRQKSSRRESSHAPSRSKHEGTLKPSTAGVYGSVHHGSTHRDSNSKHDSALKPTTYGSRHHGSRRESTSDRLHALPSAYDRLASIKEEPSHDSEHTIKPIAKATTHTPSRTRRTSWSNSHKETSTALQSLVPSRSNHVSNLDPRTANRLLRASRNQSLDGSEMEFLVDALAEGLIKPSEFEDFANFARRRGFFDGGKGKGLADYMGGDYSDDDDDDERRLRRADKGKRMAYYEEITVIHYKRIRRVVKK